MTSENHFTDFASSAEEAFARDATDASLHGTGFIDLLGESLDDAHVRSAVFATFVADGRRVGHSSALFRLMARPYVSACGLGDRNVVAGLTLRVDEETTQVAVPATIGDAEIVVDLGAGGVVLVAATEVSHVRVSAVDPELVAVAELDPASARVVLGSVEATAARDSAHAIGCLAAAMEILGASEALLDAAVDHARSRVQFGQPIAAFQAVQHLLALSSLDIQAMDHLCRATLRTIGSADALPSDVAKAVAGRNGRRVADRVSQVLGGTGFTWEHRFHRLHRRILVLDSLLGGSQAVMMQLARTATDGSDPAGLLSLFAQVEAALVDRTHSA